MTEKSVAEKLMIKPGRTVRLVNPPSNLESLLGQLPNEVQWMDSSTAAMKAAPADIILFFANNRTELVALLPGLRKAMAPQGMIWVAYHKGISPVKTDINRDSINAYAHTLSLQAVAMIAIDDDWSALRLKPTDGGS